MFAVSDKVLYKVGKGWGKAIVVDMVPGSSGTTRVYAILTASGVRMLRKADTLKKDEGE